MPLDPWRVTALFRSAHDLVERVIREGEPPTPSHRINSSEALPSVAANRHVEPVSLGRFVRGDLDWIVLKALAKERARRDDSAIGLASDVERFLHDEPVTAGPPPARSRTAKFLRRHRGQVGAASLVLLAIIGGVVGTTLGVIEARNQARRANEQASVARAEAAEREKARLLAERRLAQVARMNEVLGSIFRDLNREQPEKEGKPPVAVIGDRLDQAAAALVGESIRLAEAEGKPEEAADRRFEQAQVEFLLTWPTPPPAGSKP